MLVQRWSAAIAALVMLTTVGCSTGDASSSSSGGSSSGTSEGAPVLESVEAPSSLSPENGAYRLAMDLTFRDPQNDPVTQVRFRIPSGNLDQTSAIESSGPAVTRATVTVVIGADVPPMTYTYFVSVLDSAGNESAPISKEISLN